MPGMQHDLVIPLPLLGSETKVLNQADLVGGVQVRICADNVCSLQVTYRLLPDFCAYATKTNMSIALHSTVTATLMLLGDTDIGDDDPPPRHPPPPPPPLSDCNKHLSRCRR